MDVEKLELESAIGFDGEYIKIILNIINRLVNSNLK